ncbi:MAG: CPXCG motif-containing cysteine-rich protein [Candidatus Hydrogenedentes bacterium]|nr:CPXCG motif-containing cysteine-rich protein [Candidatus Hydrogenedentota bacterium]
MEEMFFECPYCAQGVSMLLDLSVNSQSYIEDCEVCCNPIQIAYHVEGNRVAEFSAQPIGQ